MSDLVVTVPRGIWTDWIAEGDAVGAPESGEEWGFFLGWQRPPVQTGERLYIVAHDRLRGYAPVTGVVFYADSCPEHNVTATSPSQPSLEDIAKLLDEAIGVCDERMALLCTEVLDTERPLQQRLLSRNELACMVASSRLSRDDNCLWCQAQTGVGKRPKDVKGRWAIGRRGGAVAVTIGPKWSRPPRHDHKDLAYIRGFQGFRPRWWPRDAEFAFPDWRDRDMWLNRAEARKKAEIAKVKRVKAKTAARQSSLFGGDHG